MSKKSVDKKLKNSRGMILAFTLWVILLMSLMGVAITMSAMTELGLSGNTLKSRESFSVADSAVQMSLMMTRLLLHPAFGTPESILNNSSIPIHRFIIKVNKNRFNLKTINEESYYHDYMSRYKLTGALQSDNSEKPHIEFFIGPQLVASAVVAISYKDYLTEGISLGSGEAYEQTASAAVQATILVSVNGRTYDPENSQPESTITAIYREII